MFRRRADFSHRFRQCNRAAEIFGYRAIDPPPVGFQHVVQRYGNLQRFEPFDALVVFLDLLVNPQLNGGILRFKRLGIEIPIVGGDIDSRAYIAAATIDGKTQVDVRGAILIDAVFSANGINADTHNVAALCRQARTVFYRRKTWLNKW